MEQPGQKDVYMAVPEASGYNQSFAFDDLRMAGDFDCGPRPDGNDVAVMYKDCAIFDGLLCRRGINLCADQGEVSGTSQVARKKYPQHKESWSESESHVLNINITL